MFQRLVLRPPLESMVGRSFPLCLLLESHGNMPLGLSIMAWGDVQIIIGDVEDAIELRENFTAYDAHFLCPKSACKETCGRI